MKYNRKKVTLCGLSFGFVVVTRMLQRYPELQKKVDMLISVVGFAHRDDLVFSPFRHNFYKFVAGFFSFRVPAVLFSNIALRPLFIRTFYAKTNNAKFNYLTAEEKILATEMEVKLWRCNEVRTYMKTTLAMLNLDNCNIRIPMNLWHISVNVDHYLDNKIVVQHLSIIYDEVESFLAKMETHAPTVIASKSITKPLIPQKVRQALRKQPA